MLRRACACLLLAVFSAALEADQKPRNNLPPPPASIGPLDLGRALDLYAAGRFDEAVRSVALAGDEIGRNLRGHWAVTGRQWIDAEPARRPQRILAAAALALETEHIRAERGDWRALVGTPPCGGACVLDWAQLLLVQRGAPDPAERAWYLAAAALASGNRDWRYLQRTVDPERAPQAMPGLMDRAAARFPADPLLLLERALAAAGRFNTTIDVQRGRRSIAFMAFDGPDNAARLLTPLVDDPVVGVEARLRLGYLYWIDGRDEAARDELAKTAERAGDADIRYLAHFLLGRIAIARGENGSAIPHLQAALAARPGFQSAAVALAALELQRGDADTAHEIARTSLDQPGAAVDPWRLFLYGHHPQWPARLAELRRGITP